MKFRLKGGHKIRKKIVLKLDDENGTELIIHLDKGRYFLDYGDFFIWSLDAD